jgi:hypothetical protein
MVLRWSDLSGQWSAPAADTFVGAGVLRATPLHCGVAATRLNHDFYRIFGIFGIFGMMPVVGRRKGAGHALPLHRRNHGDAMTHAATNHINHLLFGQGSLLFGQGSTLSALSTQAVPASLLFGQGFTLSALSTQAVPASLLCRQAQPAKINRTRHSLVRTTGLHIKSTNSTFRPCETVGTRLGLRFLPTFRPYGTVVACIQVLGRTLYTFYQKGIDLLPKRYRRFTIKLQIENPKISNP